METLSAVNVTTNQAPSEVKATDVKAVEAKVEVTAPAALEQKLEPLPPSGPYKPSVKEIQTALKNSNFYAGEVDGKLGPKTKAAIEEFQKANGLKVDGKVGPMTWQAMSKYVDVAAKEAVEKR
ncbi:MAG: peptidoglycan-binding protein [Candidatus Omnitrophica bacterium]|nr:peptidoglycan-binding protein [Candidatus Omnitrophota bacterium]